MKQGIILLTLTGLLITACNVNPEKQKNMDNPFFSEYETSFQVPPFEQIKPEHYMPAFTEGMKQQMENIEKIVANTEEPTFENTIEAYENSGELLNKVGSVFFNLKAAATNNDIQDISKEIAPAMSIHNDDIKLNAKLFEKVKAIHDNEESLNLTTEQSTLLDKTYKAFVRGGANLKTEHKDRFREINKELSLLYTSL